MAYSATQRIKSSCHHSAWLLLLIARYKRTSLDSPVSVHRNGGTGNTSKHSIGLEVAPRVTVCQTLKLWILQLHMDAVDILHFLFLLGSLELGQDYDIKSLTPTQKGMLEDLRDYGIVYQRKVCFVPFL